MKKSRTRKYVIAILLCLMMIAASICGCTKKEDDKTTVKFSYPAYGYNSDKEQAFWDDVITKFEKENPNIKIDMTNEDWGDVFTKWDNYISDKNTPDIGICDYVDATAYGVQGSVQPVNDVIEDLGGADQFTDDAQLAKDGKNWWSVPYVSSNLVLGFRQDLLEAAGFKEAPKTWDELMTMSKALTSGKQYGLGMNVSESWLSNQLFIAFVKAAGGSFENEKGEVTVTSDAKNQEALQFIADLYQSGAVPEDCLTWEGGEDLNSLATGHVAMAIMWGGQGSTVKDSFPEQYDQIKFATLPAGPSGQSGSFVGNAGLFLFKDAKHSSEAKKFIKFLLSEEVQNDWAMASGNVSPLKSVASSSELQKESWYKAIADQTLSGTNYYIGGKYNEALSLFAQNDGFGPNVYAAVKGADAAKELENAMQKIKTIQKQIADR